MDNQIEYFVTFSEITFAISCETLFFINLFLSEKKYTAIAVRYHTIGIKNTYESSWWFSNNESRIKYTIILHTITIAIHVT